MSNLQINHNEVQEAADTRRTFLRGAYIHFIIFAVVNILIWGAWALGPKDGSAPYVPIIITGSWAIILIVHAVVVFFSHRPHEAAVDEINRQVDNADLRGDRR
jgi:fatty acid desaturase